MTKYLDLAATTASPVISIYGCSGYFYAKMYRFS